MLKVFRDNLKYFSWVLWIVIAAFILFYIPDFMAPGGAAGTAARVWDQEITSTELQTAHRRLEEEMRQQLGERFSEVAEQLQLPQRALQRVIDQKILVREARRMGLTVSDQELSRAILDHPSFQDSGKFIGEERYRRLLRRNGLRVAEFEEDYRQDLLIDKLQQVLSHTLYVSDQELEKSYRQRTERARIRYLELPSSRFNEEVEVSEEEIANHFQEHRSEYRLPERRELAYLQLKLGELRRNLPVEEAELFAYYQENEERFASEEQVRARHILLTTAERSPEEARAQIEAVRDRIEAGEDFAALARELSEDPASAQQGGQLQPFGPGQMTPEFEKAAFEAEIGELVGPVETPFGVHLLEVQERREARTRPFAEVRSQIQSTLAAERAPEAAENRIQALAEEVGAAQEVSPEQLETLAQEAGSEVVFGRPSPVSRGDSIPGLGRAPALFDAAFELGPGELSDPVQLPNGDWALVYVQDVLPPRDQTLEEVKSDIREQIAARKQQQMAVDRLDEARQSLEQGKTLDEVAAELEVELRETPEFGPRSPIQGLGYSPKVSQAALSMDEGAVGGPYESGSGALIFEVTERKRWDPEQFEQQKTQLRQRLRSEKQQRLLTSLLLERRNDMRADNALQIFDPQLRELLNPQA